MKKIFICLGALMGLSALPVLGQDHTVEQMLKNQFERHTLVLRSAFQRGDQSFDSTGKPLKEPLKDGKWEAFGPIYVQKLRIDSKAVELEGPRVVMGFEGRDQQQKSVLIPLSKPLTVRIKLDHPIASVDEAHLILNRVFFSDVETSDYSQPTYWQSDQTADSQQSIAHAEPGACCVPTAVYSPDPDYSDTARHGRVEGTLTLKVVIDRTGRVSRIAIKTPLGYGLDENAVNMVKTWRFRPGTRDGQPAPFEVSVEVHFQLS